MKDPTNIFVFSKIIATTSSEESIELSYIPGRSCLISIFTRDEHGATTYVFLRRAQVVELITELALFLAAT